jgi:outer membrane biosynthesis protein TonB
VGNVKDMTETPGRPSDPEPEPQSNETTEATPAETSEPVTEPTPDPAEPVTEPTPAATGEPPAEPTPAATSAPTAGVTGESRAKWRWLENRRNRIAASAAVVAGAVAVAAASFTGGFVAGAHSGAAAEHQAQWGHRSEMSAYPEHARTGQIWIIPGGETAQGEGYIIAESR